jgi:hypothetical protein
MPSLVKMFAMCFRSAFRDHQVAGDSEIGTALGHQGQHVMFPVGQLMKRIGWGALVADEVE